MKGRNRIMKKKMITLLAVCLTVVIMAAPMAFAARDIVSYSKARIPNFGGKWYSPTGSKKVTKNIDGVNNYSSGSYSVSTCLVIKDGSSYKAVTTEYSIAPVTRKLLPFKDGYKAKGGYFGLYMRSGLTQSNTWEATGSFCSDHKD